MVKITCERCKKIIKDSEQRFSIKEHILNPSKVLIDKHFHSNCWVKQYNESLDKKVQAYSKRIMKATVPALKHLMGGNSGGDFSPMITIK